MQTAPISLLIPCYNSEKYIARAINSGLNQTVQFGEIICYVDGGSDRTASIAREMGVQVIEAETNHGPGYARNRLAEAARFPYLHFHDSDDVMEANLVARVVPHLRPDTILFCPYIDHALDTGEPHEIHYHGFGRLDPVQFALENFIPPECVVLHSDLFAQVRYYEDMRLMEDKLWFLLLASRAPRLEMIEQALVRWLRRPDSLMHSQSWLNMLDVLVPFVERASKSLPQDQLSAVAAYVYTKIWEAYYDDEQCLRHAAAVFELLRRLELGRVLGLGQREYALSGIVGAPAVYWMRKRWAQLRSRNLAPGS